MGEDEEQIRELCPVRVQSAGGNASGKPPYPCSDLEDAPAAACSRHSGQRSCTEYQPAVENNTTVSWGKSAIWNIINKLKHEMISNSK